MRDTAPVSGVFVGGLSIVVPCGRPERARATVQAILAQNWVPADCELVLAGVNVDALVAEVTAQDAMAVHAAPLPERRNPAQTRLAGTEIARSANFLFVDDDIELAPDFLRGLAQVLAVQDHPGCVGPRLPGRSQAYFSRVVDLANFWSQQAPEGGPRGWLYSAALYVDGAAWQATGGFRTDLDIGEDVDLTQRVAATGRTLWYAGDLIAVHNHRRTSLACATAYFWGNGELARHLFPPSPELDSFRISRVSKGLRGNLRATLDANGGVRGLRLYLPGITAMYLVFCISLEIERMRLRLALAAQSASPPPAARGRCAARLFRRACAAYRAHRGARAMHLYLLAGLAQKLTRRR